MNKVIGLRSGHYGATSNTGASANGVVEVKVNKDVYDIVANKLKTIYGFTVINKSGNLGSTVYNHYNKYLPSNEYLLLCIHHEGQGNTDINGSLAITSIFAKDKTIANAKLLVKYFTEAFGSNNRGLYSRKGSTGKDYYEIIRETKPSVILGEALVLTNKQDAEYIKYNYDSFINTQAECYIKVACNWYNIPYKSNPVSENLNDEIIKLEKKIEIMQQQIKQVTANSEVNTMLIKNIKNNTANELKINKIIKWIESYEK